MTEPEDQPVTIKEEIVEVTRADGEANMALLANPAHANYGVVDDDEDPESEVSEMATIADLILGVEGTGAAASGAAAASSITAHQRRALALALAQRGPIRTPKRTPLGSNCNPYSRYFGFGCQFWCADFLAYCVDMTSHHPDHHVAWGPPSAVKNITRWGQKHGKIYSQPRKGDIFTYKNGEHTGFVLSAHGSSFRTIEGNTSGPLGDVYVASHSRNASSGQYWFVRWDF